MPLVCRQLWSGASRAIRTVALISLLGGLSACSAGDKAAGWGLPYAAGTSVSIGPKGLHGENFGSLPGGYTLTGSSSVSEASLDLVVTAPGTPVYPLSSGTVLEAWSGCNVVLVDHGGGTWVEYMHLELTVSNGQAVTPTASLGTVMSPYDRSKVSPCYDDSTAPHVHFAFLKGSGTSGQYQSMQGMTLCGHVVDANGDLVGLASAGGPAFVVPDCAASGSEGNSQWSDHPHSWFVPYVEQTVLRVRPDVTVTSIGEIVGVRASDAVGPLVEVCAAIGYDANGSRENGAIGSVFRMQQDSTLLYDPNSGDFTAAPTWFFATLDDCTASALKRSGASLLGTVSP